jgi:CheY-like chemotaxis protein
MSRPIEVLLVEDNPADAFLTTETFETSERDLSVSVVVDGPEALTFLRRLPPHERAPVPDLILLDLNLPKLDGLGVLADLRKHEASRGIPVVILTSSEAESDVSRSYDLGANCYVTKPMGLAAFQAALRSVEDFWFKVVRLP